MTEPKKYKIRTIDDLLEVVNEDNVENLAEDIRQFLTLNAHMKKIGATPKSASFNWTDDGATGIKKVVVTFNGGE